MAIERMPYECRAPQTERICTPALGYESVLLISAVERDYLKDRGQNNDYGQQDMTAIVSATLASDA